VTAAAEKPRYVRGGPPRVTRSPLTGTWYVVSAYHDLGGGRFAATQKREVHPDDAAGLERLWSAAHEAQKEEASDPLHIVTDPSQRKGITTP